MAYEFIVMKSKETLLRLNSIWIHAWNEYLWSHKSYFVGDFMVSYKKHSAAVQYYLCQWAPAECPGFLLFAFGPIRAQRASDELWIFLVRPPEAGKL